jgi:hypothetical protein
MDDMLFKPVQVLQQPDAGAAMDRRDVKLDFADPAVGKIDQSVPDFRIIEIGIFLTDLFFIDPDARMVLDIVILTCVAAFEYFINRPASLAAKGFVIKNYGVYSAILPAVIAACFCAGFQGQLPTFFILRWFM